jgi:hypothetical protein
MGCMKWQARQELLTRLSIADQCSDWERRPLLPSQVRYAALDALCLLAIADVLLQEMNSGFRSGGLATFNNRPFEPRPLQMQDGDWRKHCSEDWLTTLSHRKKLHAPAGRPSAKAAKTQPAQDKLKQGVWAAHRLLTRCCSDCMVMLPVCCLIVHQSCCPPSGSRSWSERKKC